MTDEDVVELGLRAEALLGSSTFKFVVDYLAESYVNNWLTSNPHDAETREVNYHLHHALNDIVAQLGACAARAHELVEEGQQRDDE